MTTVSEPQTSASTTTPARVPTFALMRRLFAYRPGLFLLNVVLWGAFQSLPALFGYSVSRIFAALGDYEKLRQPEALHLAWLMVGVFALARFSRFGTLIFAFPAFIRLWYTFDALLRRNLISHLLLASGSRRLPDTPAEAISRFRDDVEDVASYSETWLDAVGFLIYVAVALTLMARVDPLITLVVVTPLLLVVLLVQRLSPTIRSYRRRMREATARVTDFVGESFAAVSAVKLSASEDRLVSRLETLGETRRKAALRDVLLTELLKGVNSNMIAIATGLVLLMGASRFRTGTLSLGDFVLFAALLPRLTGSMGFFGDMIARHRRTGVGFERMRRLLQDAPVEAIVAHGDVALGEREDTPPPVAGRPTPPALSAALARPLEQLEVSHLTAAHPSQHGELERGVRDVSFSLGRGEFVVVTGRIGSGKTTLVRALLGLIPASGETRWNGETVTDPAQFFVPPRSSYTAQLPQLFSETLEENVRLGEEGEGSRERLSRALRLAVMHSDLGELERGLETSVGARGVKLSGGQVQRAAVARMLARDADLLVFDDVSSALDAATEAQLWAGLFSEMAGVTCLVVSHRRAALKRADRILLLQGGELVDTGTLSELLARSEEMRELWAEDAGEPSLLV